MEMKDDYKRVNGWLPEAQARVLHDYALLAPIPNYFEIGTFAGRSASVIANVAKERNGFLVCVDFFMKNHKLWGTETIIPDVLLEFLDNMKKQGVQNNVIALKGNTDVILPTISGMFGMIYVDGGHIEKYLNQNLEWAYEHTVEGGYILCHDYGNIDWPDVKKCVDAFVKSNQLRIVANVSVYPKAGGLVVIKR